MSGNYHPDDCEVVCLFEELKRFQSIKASLPRLPEGKLRQRLSDLLEEKLNDVETTNYLETIKVLKDQVFSLQSKLSSSEKEKEQVLRALHVDHVSQQSAEKSHAAAPQSFWDGLADTTSNFWMIAALAAVSFMIYKLFGAT